MPHARTTPVPVTILLFALAVCSSFVRAQSPDTSGDWEKVAGGKMSFDVASVKQNKSGLPPTGNRPHSNVPFGDDDSYAPTGGLLTVGNYTVADFISFAYRLSPPEAQAMRSKLPNWARGDRFDIEGRGAANATKDQMRLMMQSLLADRFKLAAHFETHDGPIYDLLLAKPGQTGPQLTAYSDAHPCIDPLHPAPVASIRAPSIPCGTLVADDMPDGGIRVSEGDVTIQKIADDLPMLPPANLNRPVVDHTGLTGNYDLSIDFPKGMSRAGVSVDQPEPSFGELLQEQLGLRLESAVGPIRSLIIDHIEEPTPN